MGKTDRCVVRNQAYRRAGAGIRERHNERKNISYANADIDTARSPLNVHYKQCAGSYAETFDRMVENGEISTRGLQKDAKVIDEMVFDVNSAYFERGGGYDYAKRFFEDAYKLAVKEAGGEQYILSAVMHADERNKALSEQLGRDIYHYHLHVVYIPVVEKEIKWSKRCRDPTLIGTTKEVIRQVSHSKKWASEKALDENGSVVRNENGRAVLINAYSLLQDRFFEYMQMSGYRDFERGERGSTAVHLSTLDYKIKQESERLDRLNSVIEGKEKQSVTLEKTVRQTGKQLDGLDKRLAVTQKAYGTYQELESMGKKNLLGKYELQPDEYNKLLTLAKTALSSMGITEDLRNRLADTQKSLNIYQNRWQELKNHTKDYLEAERLFPEETRTAIEAIKRKQNTMSVSNRNHRRHQDTR